MAAETPPPPSIETLLEERAWLRRVARALAADESAADDLEQDAWLAAMRRPPKAASAARAWFRRVLTHRAGEVHRRAGRRRAREEVASRPEAEPSTADIVARAEAQRRVVEAVFALEEPWKTTVLLRYFEDMDTAAIAARTGAPPDTVRARLRKAHADLRRSLEPRERETRPAWALVLGLPASHPAPIPAPLEGGVLLSSTPKLAAAAVILVAVGLTFWAIHDGTSDGAGAPTTTVTATDAAASPNAAHDTAPATARRQSESSASTNAAAVPDGSASLAGEVRLVDGDAPAADVDVVLRTGAFERRTKTDARGAFRFEVAPAGESLSVTATRGATTARAAGLRLERGESRRLDTLWLDAPLRIRAKVVGPSLEPIAGATVEAYRVRAHLDRQDWDARSPEPDLTETTDERGAASFAQATVGTWRLRAVHPDFAPAASGDVQALRGGVDAVVCLRMERGDSLEGRVRTQAGAPLADMRVLLLPPVAAQDLMDPVPVDVRRLETKTDAEGHYRFAAVPAGDHALAVARAGALPARIGIVTTPAVRVFDAVLDGGVLTGRVTAAEDGRPIEGVRIRAAVWRRHSPTFLAATSGADGRYAIDVPLGGIVQGPARGEGEAKSMPVHFEVEKEGFAFAPELGATPWRALWVLGGETTQFDLVMRRAASLAGRVAGPDGPVAGAEVVADVWNETRGSLPSRTTTDATGAFRFGGLPEGRARVVVSRSGYVQVPSPGDGWRTGAKPDARTVVEIPKSGEANIELRVERGATVTGRVLSGGRPVPMAAVAAVSGEIRRQTTTGADGGFVLAGLRTDASAKLHVVRDGFVDADAEVAATQDAAPPVEIVLEPLGAARGRVVGPDGAAVPGAWVQVAPAKLALDAGYEVLSVWHRAERVSVAPDGNFDAPIAWFDGASADGVVVRAGAPGLAPAISGRLPAPRGGPVDAGTLKLEAGNRLEGRVVAADGSGPVAGAEIEFMNETLPPALGQRRDWSAVGRDQTPFEWVARTGADGTFAIDGLPAWRYELRVNAEGFDGAGPTVAVPSDKPAVIELTRLLPIAGRVETEDGAPAGGVIVMAVVPGRGPVGQTESRADGGFEFQWIGAGRYLLEARRAWDVTSDLVAAQVPDVEAGRRDVKIVMRRAGGTISGRCAASTGAAVPGAVIRLKPPKGTPILLARSAADGRFTVAGLEGGPWAITADANRVVGGPEGFGKRLVAQAQDVAVGTTDLVLEFRDTAPITGRVLRADRSPAQGMLMVNAKRVGGAWTLMCPLLAGGAFRFDNATAGAWTLTVVDTSNGSTLRTVGATEVEAPRADVELVLGGDQALAGRVVDEQGHPVAGALVAARSGGSGRAGGAGATLPATVTDAEGRFQWTSAAEGTWTVTATEPATGRAEATQVSAGTTDLALTLHADTTVAARVVSAADAPVRGAVVTLHAEGGLEVAKLRTDSEGRFTTKALRAGAYEVRLAERDGRAIPESPVLGSVTAGATSVVLRVAD